MQLTRSSEWSHLRTELLRRIREPAGRVIFVVYFFAVVLFLGGMGWIIPLCRYYFSNDATAVGELPSAFSTFFLALIASALADIVLGGGPAADNHLNSIYKGFKVFAFGLALVGIPLAFAGLQRSESPWTYIASVTGMVMSLFLWWVLNADSGKWVDDSIEVTPPIGGSTAVELRGSAEGLIT